MRSPLRLLFAGLFLSSANATEPSRTPPPTPPSQNTPTPASWSQVEQTTGELAFVQALTAFALSAPIEDFPVALAAIERWQPPAPRDPFLDHNFPIAPDSRITRARRTLACGFITRAPDAAIAYHAQAPRDVLLHFRPLFFDQLTRLNPDLARAERLKLPTDDERQQAAASIVIALSQIDSATALALCQELRVTEASAIAAVFEATARRAPHQALAALATLPDDRLRSVARESVLTEWIQKSLDDALAWISSHIPKADRPAFLDIVLERAGRRNFALLTSLEDHARDPLIQSAATRAIGRHLIHQPIQYAWDRVLTRGWDGIDTQSDPADPRRRSRTLDDLVRHASTQPPDQVRKFFRSLPSDVGHQLFQPASIMQTWTLADPDGALAWADKFPESLDKTLDRETAMRIGQIMLVELDPELAFARLDALPPGEMRTHLAQTTFFELAKKDLITALTRSPLPDSVRYQIYGMAAVVRIASTYAPDTMVALVRETSSPNAFTSAFASEWLFNEPEDALAWYFAQPAGPLKTELQDSAAQVLARSDPTRAIDFALATPDVGERLSLVKALIEHHTVAEPASVLTLIDTLPTGVRQMLLRDNALGTLAEADPARAVILLDSGALGSINRRAITGVAMKWAEHSAADAARWLTPHLSRSQNQPGALDHAITEVAGKYAQQDPAAALTWARTLADPAAAAQATAAAIETIGKSSRPFTLRLLAESALPDKQKAELEAALRR